MKYCTHCGNPNDDGVTFCPKCGQAVSGAQNPQMNFNNGVGYNNVPVQNMNYNYNNPYPNMNGYGYYNTYKPETPGIAKASMILGIIADAVLWMPSISFILAVLGLIFSLVSRSKTGNAFCPSAKAGFICSVIALSLFVIVILFAMLWGAVFFSSFLGCLSDAIRYY